MSGDLRQTIRRLVLEELASRDPGSRTSSSPREEMVAINSDQDLAGFVGRLIGMVKNERLRADIESGRYVFRLNRRGGGTLSTGVAAPAFGRTIRLQGKLVSEKQVRGLDDDIAVLEVAKDVRFTPLASDALRQAGIKIKRVTK